MLVRWLFGEGGLVGAAMGREELENDEGRGER